MEAAVNVASLAKTKGGFLHSAADREFAAELMRGMPTAVYACDADGLITAYNDHAAALWGERPVLGDARQRYCGSYRLLWPDGRPLPHEQCPMAHAVRSGTVVRDAEVIIERRDGSRRVVLVNIHPLRDNDGAVVGAINSLVDITERKRMEETLEAQRHDLEDFFENAAIALHWVGSDGKIIRANQAELDLLGYSREDYIGQPIAKFHADAEAIKDILARLRRGETIDKYPARLRAKDGSFKHVLITSSGQFRHGEFVHTRCFTFDVTTQHQAEEALRKRERWFGDLLDALPVAVYTTDTAGRITFFNKAAVELSGRVPELGTDTWCVTWRLYQPDGRPLPHDECPMAVALKENRLVRGMEAVAERPDGARIPFLPYPTPLRDDSGQLVGAVNVLVDITDRKESETRISTLLNELNHRVKNTLSTVQALAVQSFQKRTLPDARQAFIGRLMALAAVHDLLSGRASGHADLRALLEGILSPYRDTDEERLTLRGEALPLTGRTAIPLAMLMHEMATNAAKYGALSVAGGSLAVSWSVTRTARETRVCSLRWIEQGGPAVARPSRAGFGLRLVEAIVPQQMKGTAELDFSAAGLVGRFDFPVSDTEGEPES